jgi:hypothetical protein
MIAVSKPGKHLSIAGPNKSMLADEDHHMSIEANL